MKIASTLADLGRRLAPAWLDRALVLKAISFGLIGVVNASIDFGVFSLGYFYFGLPLVVANVLAWCVAVTNSYVLNSLITFAAESGRQLRLRAYFAFAATQLGGLAANTTTVLVASLFVPVLVAKLMSMVAAFIVDFTLSHVLVFRRRSDPQH
ncbi:MAG TPA: GtrA family protein [Reyranella sp.]|nr:GtrA family protein [Reyranella sp.]